MLSISFRMIKLSRFLIFADFLIQRYEELQLTNDMQQIASGQSFDFLKDEEDLYTENDLKETYGKR